MIAYTGNANCHDGTTAGTLYVRTCEYVTGGTVSNKTRHISVSSVFFAAGDRFNGWHKELMAIINTMKSQDALLDRLEIKIDPPKIVDVKKGLFYRKMLPCNRFKPERVGE